MEILTGSNEYDYEFGVFLLGDHGVGKSTLCKRMECKDYNKFMESKKN